MKDEDIFYSRVCDNLKKQMKSRCIKQYEIAEMLGIAYSTFNSKMNIRCHNGKFSIYQLKLIADELLMSVDELINV